MTMITIDALNGDGSFSAWCVEPADEPRGAVVVIQEIFGVNPGIRQKCAKLAADGYLALAPDLFWRQEKCVELDADNSEEFQRGVSLMMNCDLDMAVSDIEATIRAARAKMGGGKVGAVGYCMGGRLAYMTAARTDIDASVGYYGVGIDALLGEKHAIARPLLLHIPQEDGFVPPEAQAKIHEGLDDHPRVTIYDYPGEDHGFATEMGERRSEQAAQLADTRTAAFFAEHIG